MKLLLAVALAVILSVMLVTPVFADEPEDPGCLGQIIKGEAQNDDGPGIAPETHLLQGMADSMGTNMGQLLKSFMEPMCGIPPKHTP